MEIMTKTYNQETGDLNLGKVKAGYYADNPGCFWQEMVHEHERYNAVGNYV